MNVSELKPAATRWKKKKTGMKHEYSSRDANYKPVFGKDDGQAD
jgi:hypothetical protein